MTKRLHHVGILVDDFRAAKTLLGETLGLRLSREMEVPARSRRVAFFECGEAEIELIEDLDLKARERNLGGSTARIEHVAIEVDNVQTTLDELGAAGVRPDRNGLVRSGTRVNAWTEPRTTSGIMFQFLSESERISDAPIKA